MIFICIEDFVQATDIKSCYFPPLSLVISSNWWSCMVNPQTG